VTIPPDTSDTPDLDAVDHANPELRTPLDSTLVEKARRSDRYGDAVPWPLAVR
jgi:hypothetical protein